MKTKQSVELNSRRQYRMVFSDTGINGHPVEYTIQSIINFSIKDDYEWAHALVDRLDDVLDLVIGETMHFHPNRDDKDIRKSHGLITRIR